MLKTQESKFDAIDGRLVNRISGQPIPDDEPVFVLRAKDQKAVKALEAYYDAVTRPEHIEAVKIRIDDFRRFSKQHPERMKEPDTNFPADGEGDASSR